MQAAHTHTHAQTLRHAKRFHTCRAIALAHWQPMPVGTLSLVWHRYFDRSNNHNHNNSNRNAVNYDHATTTATTGRPAGRKDCRRIRWCTGCSRHFQTLITCEAMACEHDEQFSLCVRACVCAECTEVSINAKRRQCVCVRAHLACARAYVEPGIEPTDRERPNAPQIESSATARTQVTNIHNLFSVYTTFFCRTTMLCECDACDRVCVCDFVCAKTHQWTTRLGVGPGEQKHAGDRRPL